VGSRPQTECRMAKKKTADLTPKLTESEQDLSQLEHGYQLETDSLGGNPVLRRLKDDEVIRPVSANASSVKALQQLNQSECAGFVGWVGMRGLMARTRTGLSATFLFFSGATMMSDPVSGSAASRADRSTT